MPILPAIRRGRKWVGSTKRSGGNPPLEDMAGRAGQAVLVSGLGRHPCRVLAQCFPVYKTQSPSHYNRDLRAEHVSDTAVPGICMRKGSFRTSGTSEGQPSFMALMSFLLQLVGSITGP